MTSGSEVIQKRWASGSCRSLIVGKGDAEVLDARIVVALVDFAVVDDVVVAVVTWLSMAARIHS